MVRSFGRGLNGLKILSSTSSLDQVAHQAPAHCRRLKHRNTTLYLCKGWGSSPCPPCSLALSRLVGV
jgi:hypothetical protein